MKFYIGGNLIEIDISDPAAVKTLLSLFQQLPTSCDLREITSVAALPQDRMVGVQEKGYIVIQANDTDNIHIAGTIGLLHCLGISLYDPAINKLVIAHFDIGTDHAQLQVLLNEFNPGSRLIMRIFGGMCEKEVNELMQYSHDKSKELLNNLLSFLCRNATGDFAVNLVSNDTFEKLATFKHTMIAQKLSAKISFAIDCRTGHIIQCRDDQYPYTITINNCGLFTGIYQTRGVCPKLLRYFGIAPEILFKWLDNSSPQAQANCIKMIREAGEYAPIRILIAQLCSLGFAANDTRTVTDRMLFNYLVKNFPDFISPLCNDDPIKITLDHVCVEILANLQQPIPAILNQSVNDLPLMRIINSNVIQNWCKKEIRQQIAHLLFADTEDSAALQQALKGISGSLHLLEECIVKQQYDLQSLSCESNLLNLLAKRDRPFNEIIETWAKEKINEGLKRIANNICMKLEPPFNHPEINAAVLRELSRLLNVQSVATCNLDIFHHRNLKVTRYVEELTEALQKRLNVLATDVRQMAAASHGSERSLISKLCCLPSASSSSSDAAEIVREQAIKVITETLNQHINDIISLVSTNYQLHSSAAAAAAMSSSRPGLK